MAGSPRLARMTAVTVGALVAALLVTGCTQAAPQAPPGGEFTTSPQPGAVSSTEPGAVPTFDPDGDADSILEYFDFVNHRTLASKPDATGADFVDALVEAGFPKKDIQVTPDRTSVNLQADSIQFAVLLHDTCFIGQNGSGSGGYHSEAVPRIPGGSCLVGLGG